MIWKQCEICGEDMYRHPSARFCFKCFKKREKTYPKTIQPIEIYLYEHYSISELTQTHNISKEEAIKLKNLVSETTFLYNKKTNKISIKK